MAVLGDTTLTGCDSIPDFIATGSVKTFYQSAAPLSWTRIISDSANNRMLRLVSSGVGGGVGGSASPILNDVVPVHTHSFTSGTVSADHSHGIGDPGHAHNLRIEYDQSGGGGFPKPFPGGGLYGATITGTWVQGAGTGVFAGGTSVNHTHSGTTDNGSSSTNWAPRYVDGLLCSKN